MSSFQKRVESFKDWNIPGKNCTPAKLASAFFISEDHTAHGCVCIFCKKPLEGWSPTDVPITEHYDHQKDCPIFTLSNLESRVVTFSILNKNLLKSRSKKIKKMYSDESEVSDFNDNRKLYDDKTAVMSEKLARCLALQGFFCFTLKEKSKYDLFCYRCGYYLSDKHDLSKEEALGHYKFCSKKKILGTFNVKNPTGIFVIDLLVGKYGAAMECFCNSNLYLPTAIRSNFDEFLKYDNNASLYENIGSVLNKKVECMINEMGAVIDEEIEKVMERMDKQFVECTKNIG